MPQKLQKKGKKGGKKRKRKLIPPRKTAPPKNRDVPIKHEADIGTLQHSPSLTRKLTPQFAAVRK